MGKNTVASKPPKNYEDAMSELETLLSDMEQGALSLDDTLVAYARGAELLKFCREKLAVVDAQVKVLDGGALKPFEPEDAA